jgi:large subunit ribosomal protein L23
MNQERIYKIVVGPVISEKAAVVGESDQVVFKVAVDATKLEIKKAIEKLFDVKVVDVRTALVKGKTKRTRFGVGKRSDWKKAYVRLEQGQDIDFTALA